MSELSSMLLRALGLEPTHHRDMCEHCDAVRCDAYPGECKR